MRLCLKSKTLEAGDFWKEERQGRQAWRIKQFCQVSQSILAEGTAVVVVGCVEVIGREKISGE